VRVKFAFWPSLVRFDLLVDVTRFNVIDYICPHLGPIESHGQPMK
jgi:hypothetical protein